MQRLYTYGAVPRTSLDVTIDADDTAITLDSATGWPDTGPFVITLERDTPNEERITIQARSGTTLTVAASGRGTDGTTARSHTAGSTCWVEHTLSGEQIDALNASLAAATTKGDILVHDGSDLIRKAVGAEGLPLVSESSDATGVAYQQLTGLALADDSINGAAIADDSIDTNHISSGAITGPLIADDAVDSQHYVDGSIDTAHLGNLQVTTGKLADASVTAAKLASGMSPPLGVTSDPSSGMVEGQWVARTDLDRFKVATAATTVTSMGAGSWWTANGRVAFDVEISQLVTSGTDTYLTVDAEFYDPQGIISTGVNEFVNLTSFPGLWWIGVDCTVVTECDLGVAFSLVRDIAGAGVHFQRFGGPSGTTFLNAATGVPGLAILHDTLEDGATFGVRCRQAEGSSRDLYVRVRGFYLGP